VNVLMPINTWANRCGYFFNAYLTPKDPNDTGFYPGRDPSPNNGYNCRHPECEEVSDGVGCCHTFSCPLGYEADEEDCEAFGVEYEEGEFIVVDIAPEDFKENCMWEKKRKRKKKYRVFGHTTVTVTVEVEADTEEDAYRAANEQLAGLSSFLGNGGDDKLIGVEEPDQTVAADEDIVYDDYELLDDEDDFEEDEDNE